MTGSGRRPAKAGRARVRAGGDAPEPTVVRTPLGAALPAAAWSAALGLAVVTLLVVVGWLAGPENAVSSGQAAAAGAQGWLLANFADLSLVDGAVSLTPLGLALVPAYVLYRSGCWAARAADVRSWGDAARTAGLLAVAYGGIAGTVSVLASTTSVVVEIWSALLGSVALSLCAGGLGVLRGSGLWPRLRRVLPPEPVAIARGALAGLATLLMGGAVMVAASLAVHGGQVTELWSALGPDPAGGVLLLLLCVALVPNAVVWAVAYCVGPGFAVGVGTAVAPTGVALGGVPALPVLGALPASGDAPGASLVGLVVPVLAGLAVGVVVARDRRLRRASPARAGLVAAGSGVACGVLLGLLAGVSAGAVGGGRMAALGPAPLEVALVAALELAAVAAATAWEYRRLSSHRAARTIRL